MAVFFSGEDNSELNDIAPLFTYYVSVIVNNKSEIDAKLAFVIEMESNVNFNATLDKSVTTQLSLQKTRKLATVNFEIIREAATLVDNIYHIRLSEIRAEIAKKKAVTPYKSPYQIAAPTANKNRNAALSITDSDLYQQQRFENDLFTKFDKDDYQKPDITEQNIVDFIADLVQEDGVQDLNVILDNLITDTTMKVGDIQTNVEEEFETVFTLNFSTVDDATRLDIINKAIELLKPNARKLKVNAIIQGIKNSI